MNVLSDDVAIRIPIFTLWKPVSLHIPERVNSYDIFMTDAGCKYGLLAEHQVSTHTVIIH
jgi:hypothetical protein